MMTGCCCLEVRRGLPESGSGFDDGIPSDGGLLDTGCELVLVGLPSCLCDVRWLENSGCCLCWSGFIGDGDALLVSSSSVLTLL